MGSMSRILWDRGNPKVNPDICGIDVTSFVGSCQIPKFTFFVGDPFDQGGILSPNAEDWVPNLWE